MRYFGDVVSNFGLRSQLGKANVKRFHILVGYIAEDGGVFILLLNDPKGLHYEVCADL